MGRKTIKLLCCPCTMVSVQSNHAQNDSINHTQVLKLLKNKTSGYNSMIMATHRKFSNNLECYSTHRCWSRYPTNIKCKIQGTIEGKLVFESIPKISSTIASGDTTIGSAGRAPDDIIEQNKQLQERCKDFFLLEPILETFFHYSLGGYSHRERWSRTRQNFRFQE
jgi:hypothetical protein